MSFLVFGILNTIGEFFAFLMNVMLLISHLSLLALPVTFTILLLAHAICTVIMVCKTHVSV